MFYSHEVLTSRKYGVATIWLVATLGQKSAAKKVSRKAILGVDLPRACETIITPEVPMALRLQSNLLFGVSRVYSEQCGYVLADAQTAQLTIRTLLRAVRTAQLDVDAGKARPDQLQLEDDPAFLPDILLAPLDDELLNLNIPLAAETQLSSALSIHTASSPLGSQLEGGVGGLELPSSDTVQGDGFILPGGERSSRGPRPSSLLAKEEEGALLPEVDFDFDAEGNILEFPSADRAQVPLSAGSRPLLPSDSAASARVRQDHEAGKRNAIGAAFGDLMDAHLPMFDDAYDLPSAEAGILSDAYAPQPGLPSSAVESVETAAAPQRRRARVPKIIPLDASVEMRNRDLISMNNCYLANMAEDEKRNYALKARRQAKKNADFWLLGSGISGAGNGIGCSKAKGPLADLFSGPSLYHWITSIELEVSGRKRESEEGETTDTERRVRPRLDEDQIGRGAGPELDDGLIFHGDDLEMGREAPEGLDDISSAMPWNVSASIRGSSVARAAAGAGTVAGSITGSLRLRGHRTVSASPLLGRGVPAGLEPLEANEGFTSDGTLGGDFGNPEEPVANEDFELYGPGAAVDTQTAAQSQWQKAVLDREGNNFLEFIVTAIEEKRAAASEMGLSAEDINSIEFEELLTPGNNSNVVVAQGLLHVLTLGTKNLITAKQSEPYGPITLRLRESE